MQSGLWPFSDVQEIETRVLVNGVERPHISWSTDREISNDLPVQVSSASGLRQATGTVEWAFRQSVVKDPVSPWGTFREWLPKRGDRIEIWAGNSTVTYCQFKGVIDKTTGSVGSGFQSTIIDDYDKGSTKIRHEALLAVMPPVNQGGEFRKTGLVHTYYVDLAFRAMGFYVTPKAAHAVLSIPCQGGMWPHIGKPITASSSGSYPSNHYAPWGFSVSDFTQTYVPESPRTANEPVQITLLVTEDHSGFAYIRASYDSTYVQLSINSSKVVTGIVGGASVASFVMSGSGVVQMLIKANRVTVRSNTGLFATGMTSFSGSTEMNQITVSADAASRVAGLEVSHPPASGEFNAVDFVPTATINTSNTMLMGVMRATRAISEETANSLLDQIGNATLSACWIDETGVMRWWPSLALLARNTAQTLTTVNDVLDLEWEDGLLQTAARVSIRYKQVSLQISRWQNIRLAIGSGGTLESEESSEDFVEAGVDEAWYGVDEAPTILRTENWNSYNDRHGTYMGGFFSSSGQATSEAGLSYRGQLIRLGFNRYLVKQSVGALPDDVVFNMSTSPTASALWETNRDKPLHELGGHAVAKWADSVYTPSQAGGVGPELEHDTGAWVPEDVVPRYFDFLAGQTATPKPVISGLKVVFDPRRQVGDVVTVESKNFMGVSIDALIVGVSNSADSGGVSQTLSVRVMNVSKVATSYADLDSSIEGSSLTYQQFQAIGPNPQSYSGFNTQQ